MTQVPLPLPTSTPPHSDALWASHTGAFFHGASLSPLKGRSASAPALGGKSDEKREQCPSGAAGRWRWKGPESPSGSSHLPLAGKTGTGDAPCLYISLAQLVRTFPGSGGGGHKMVGEVSPLAMLQE